MKIELNKTSCIRPFHLVNPSDCFIPQFSHAVPDKRNVWMKLSGDLTGEAVNLASGEVAAFNKDQSCETVEAKVVIE
ncbi:hypothetical protein [Aeromonas phage 3]|nr:hypothetical protein [Aeromonas phage 3]